MTSLDAGISMVLGTTSFKKFVLSSPPLISKARRRTYKERLSPVLLIFIPEAAARVKGTKAETLMTVHLLYYQ
jgi:hypothetical protein